MKKISVFALCLVLTACGGGGGGAVSQPESPTKSEYELWLEQGNTGTYQDFLDSLVSGGDKDPTDETDHNDKPTDNSTSVHKNKGELIEYLIKKGLPYYNYSKTTLTLPNGHEYNQYKYSEDSKDSVTSKKYIAHYTYNEKELQLGNYIMYTIDREYEDGTTDKVTSWEIMNRYGDKENTYTPASGTTFKGDTWARLSTVKNKPEILTGNITFKYDYLKPELILAFDNYYQIEFVKTSGYNYNIEISGENSTGNAAFDLPVGQYTNVVPAYGPGGTDTFLKTTTLRKDGIEEAFGEYNAKFDHNKFKLNQDITIDGVFGGTKQ